MGWAKAAFNSQRQSIAAMWGQPAVAKLCLATFVRDRRRTADFRDTFRSVELWMALPQSFRAGFQKTNIFQLVKSFLPTNS